MHVVVVTEKDGKIELTKDELQNLLDESYAQGKADGARINTITTTSQWDKYDTIPRVYCDSTTLL